MLPCNVRLSNKGFTLIETLVIIVIVGVLAAIAAPSFLTWYSKVKINNALAELEGALKEAQREAIRKSQNCTVTVPGGSNPVLTASPTNCFVTGDRTLKDVSLRTGVSSITFN
jgi:prepilin-type N-terminal cleavage/methylation domain-containing protein